MTREELFRAVGEVRDEQIIEAEKPRVRRRWPRYAALAASLALVLTAAWGLGSLDGMRPMEDFVALERDVGQDHTGYGESGVDGSDYSSPDGPARPVYSKGVEIGELGSGEDFPQAETCLIWLEPEEIFAMDTAIFRGVVRNVRWFQVEIGGDSSWYYRVFSVEVLEDIRGGLAVGDIYNVVAGSASTVSGYIEALENGAEAIFMAGYATADTGVGVKDDFFSYADLGELYLSEGVRFLFVDTPTGVAYAEDIYPEIRTSGQEVTLEDVEAYIRTMLQTSPTEAPVPNSDAP